MYRIRQASFYFAVLLFVCFILFPFLWQILTSFKPPEQLFKIPPDWWPSKFYLGNYINVFAKRPFLTYLQNSAIVSSVTTLFVILLGSFCAYAVAKLQFKGKTLLLGLVLTVSMFPHISMLSPLFITLKSLKLLNTYAGLILPYTTFGLPMAIWILTSFFKEIPDELEESAYIDGCTRIQSFWKVIVPLAAPGVFTTAILVFIHAWNEFLFALSFMSKDTMRTVPVAIAMFPGEHDLPWGDIAAASVVVTVPLIVMVLIFQRRIIAGLTAGGVKG